MLQRHDQRHAAARGLVGHTAGQVARVAGRQPPEHGLHMGRIGLDIGHHHDHVAWRQRRARSGGALEHRQQLVVQDFHLALRAVRHVEAQRCVVGPPGFAQRRVGGQRFQIQDGLLHLLQQAVAFHVVEQVDAAVDRGELLAVAVGLVAAIQQADVIAPLLAPRRQQRMGVQVQILVARNGGRAGFAGLSPLAGLEQFALLDDVGPVMAAGIGDHQQHLGKARQRGERLQRLLRQRRHAEHHDAPGQPRWPCIQCRYALDERLVHGGAMAAHRRRAHVIEQQPPQSRLPALVRRQWRAAVAQGIVQVVAPVFPLVQPVGAVDLVLVEQVGHARGQLVALLPVRVVAEKIAHGREIVVVQVLRDQPQQPPGEPCLVERRGGRHCIAAQHGAVGGPQETPGQLYVDRCADAQPAGVRRAGQGQFQPLRDAVALHQHQLVFERPQRRAGQPGGKQVAQILQPVAVQHHQAGFDR